MQIDVEKLEKILKSDQGKGEAGVSFGTFDLNNKPAVGVLFCLPEHFDRVEEFCRQLLSEKK